MANFTGTSGNDTLTGTTGDDKFDLSQGGDDTVQGLDGRDLFVFGATFNANDTVDGGAGGDVIRLDGDYSAGLVLGANTITSVEQFQLDGGHSYNITMVDANIAGGFFTVNATGLGAGDTLTFDGGQEHQGRFQVLAGAGNDVIHTGARADIIDLSAGGNDTVSSGAGNDTVDMGGALTAADSINGQGGNDIVSLDGDYSAGVTLASSTLRNVETLQLAGGHDYNLNIGNDLGAGLTVDASTLVKSDALTIDASGAATGALTVLAGAGDNTISGGGGDDIITVTSNEVNTFSGGGGDDTVTFVGDHFNLNEQIDGGDGNDTVVLDNTLESRLAFSATTMVNVETLVLDGGRRDTYEFFSNDATVAPGATLTVEGNLAFQFSGDAETDGHFHFIAPDGSLLDGGAQSDTFTLGSSDRVLGGGGADIFNVSGTGDTFVYGESSDSAGAGYDTITGLDFDNATILSVNPNSGLATNGVDPAVAGTLSTATFDSDLAAALDGHFGALHAVLFTANAGTLSGQTFLIIDHNNTAGYQAGVDFVIDVTGATGTLTTADFA